VRNARIDARARRMLSDRYALFRGNHDGAGFHQPDLSVAFFERAHALAAAGGVVAMLMPSKIVNAAYAEPLRRAARDRVIAIADWSDDPRRKKWFEADTFPLGIVCRAGQWGAGCQPAVPPATGRQVEVTASGETFHLPAHDLSVSTASSEWTLVPPDVLAILRRLRETKPSLACALARRPFMGVKTGDNRSFFLEAKSIREGHLITTDGVRIPLTAVCRCVRGRDLRRWSVEASQWMLWPPVRGRHSSSHPAWLKKLAAARGLEPEDFRLSFVKPEHVGIKVAWKDLSRGLAAAVLPDVVNVGEQTFPLVPNQTLYSIDSVSLDEAYAIAAVLNSAIAGALLVSVAERAKDAHYRYFGRTVGALPWPDVDAERERLVRLARRAHRGVDVMNELDAVVATIYGVTGAELAALRTFLERRLGAC
jgi:hypothetical protein